MKKILIFCLSFIFCGTLIRQNTNGITGKVTDTNKSPLGAINIMVKGTEIGTSTDKDGKFH